MVRKVLFMSSLSIWPVCSLGSFLLSIDSADPTFWDGPAEGCWPGALASAHQRLLIEDVNICSGGSHKSPSLNRNCSKLINISETTGTSGHPVPLWLFVCVLENGGDEGDDKVRCRKTLAAIQTDPAPLPVCNLHLNSPFSFILGGVLTWGRPLLMGGTRRGQLGTTGALSQSNAILPPASSIPWPLNRLWTSVT